MGKSRKSTGPRYPKELTDQLRKHQPFKDKMILKEVLGSGAVGTVRRALDRKNPKLIYAAKIEQKQALSAEVRRAEAFVREIDALTSLNHPNIVEWYGIQENDRDLALITEFAPHGDLASVGALAPLECSAVATQLMQALAYMHAQGFAHGDIKPQNMLMVDRAPVSIRLTDFGTCKRMALSKCGECCCGGQGELLMDKGRRGTMQYMAPEVLDAGDFCHASDIWSAAIVCKRLPLGVLPFKAEENEEMVAVVDSLCGPPGEATVIARNHLPLKLAMLPSSVGGMKLAAEGPLELAVFKQNPAERPCAQEILSHPEWLSFGAAIEEREVEAKETDKAAFKKMKVSITKKLRNGEDLSPEEEAFCVQHDL